MFPFWMHRYLEKLAEAPNRPVSPDSDGPGGDPQTPADFLRCELLSIAHTKQIAIAGF